MERLAHAITHTETLLGVFTTISFLGRVISYIETVLWPAYQRQIIIPLVHKLGMNSATSPANENCAEGCAPQKSRPPLTKYFDRDIITEGWRKVMARVRRRAVSV